MSAIPSTPASRIREHAAGHLAHLQQADLIRSDGQREEYRFKHSLIQEATYASLVRDQRRAIHRQVAEAILNLQPEVPEQQPSILAQHYFHAGDDEPAFEYAVRAGLLAKANHAYEEAVANFDLALQLIDRLPIERHAARIGEAFLGKGVTQEFGGRHAEAQTTFERLRDFAVRINNPSLEAEALIRLATADLVSLGGDDSTQDMLDRALDRARRAGDPLLVARTLWTQGLRFRFSDPLRADDLFHQALEIVRSPACQSPPYESGSRETEGHLLVDLMVSHMTSGRRRGGLKYGQQALAVFRGIDNLAMTADALTGIALLDYFGGDFDQALSLADEATRISTRIDNPWGMTYSGWIALSVMTDRADWSAALRLADDVLAASMRVPFLGFRANLHGVLSTIHLELGRTEVAVDQARQMGAIFGEWSPATEPWRPWTHGVLARALVASGDLAQAARIVEPYRTLPQGIVPVFQSYYVLAPAIAHVSFEQGDFKRGLEFAGQVIDRLRNETTDRFEAEMLLWRGRLHHASGAPHPAAEDLRQAAGLLARSNVRLLLWKILAALHPVLQELGDRPGAEAARSEAARLVQAIADDIEEPPLRQSFLARPEVAALLA